MHTSMHMCEEEKFYFILKWNKIFEMGIEWSSQENILAFYICWLAFVFLNFASNAKQQVCMGIQA